MRLLTWIFTAIFWPFAVVSDFAGTAATRAYCNVFGHWWFDGECMNECETPCPPGVDPRRPT